MAAHRRRKGRGLVHCSGKPKSAPITIDPMGEVGDFCCETCLELHTQSAIEETVKVPLVGLEVPPALFTPGLPFFLSFLDRGLSIAHDLIRQIRAWWLGWRGV